MIRFSDMPYARADLDKTKAMMTGLTKELTEADSYEYAREVFIAKDKLVRHILTLSAIAQVRHSIDTKDEFYQKEMNFWNMSMPEFREYEDAWTRTLIASPFRKEFSEEFGEVIFLNAELELKSFAPSIIPLMQQENDLAMNYEKFLAGAQIPFRGKIYTIAQMEPFKTDADDETRLEAWKAEGGWYRDNKATLDEMYDKLVSVRHEMSQKLGLSDYIELAYYRMTRNCYDRHDIEKFREAVQKYVVPVADSIRRKQAERLGMRYPLSFSDAELMFRSGNPRPRGNADDVVEAGRRFYDALSPESSEFFRTMLDSETMDLLAKEGKEGGGYCTGLPDYELPFIFANFNGTQGDVETITHEAGHAFEEWMNMYRIPVETVFPTMESCEVHSMSMEFFAWRSAEDFFGDDARKFRYSHLANSFAFIPYGTMVDHFQHSVFEHPEMTPDERHAEWKRLLSIYMPWMRLDGEIPFYSEGMGWQRQHHIYSFPFYYIDYCLAQTVALEFWSRIQEDYDDAWEHYMAYTRQGGSKVFTELLRGAGLKSPFEEETLMEVCGKAQKWLDEYDLTGIE